MRLFKKYKQKVTNTKGLIFELDFKPISKRLEVQCINAPSLSFIHSVEEVMKPLGFKEVDDSLMGIVYKCQSYNHFKEIVEKVRKS